MSHDDETVDKTIGMTKQTFTAEIAGHEIKADNINKLMFYSLCLVCAQYKPQTEENCIMATTIENLCGLQNMDIPVQRCSSFILKSNTAGSR